MARILCIETATKTCSVALGVDGEFASLREVTRDHFSHAEELNRFIQEALEEGGLRFQELDAIAIGSGPGSYTGLRIGVSTAKGLIYGLGIPLIALRTLRFMALARAEEKDLPREARIIPMLDARRDEVYCTVQDGKGELLEEERALELREDSFPGLEEADQVEFVGSGASKARELLRPIEMASFDPDHHPSASQMVAWAEGSFCEERFEDPFTFEPFYLKDFVPTKPKKG